MEETPATPEETKATEVRRAPFWTRSCAFVVDYLLIRDDATEKETARRRVPSRGSGPARERGR